MDVKNQEMTSNNRDDYTIYYFTIYINIYILHDQIICQKNLPL